MNVGCAQVDITPRRALTLCGFAARRNLPFAEIHDPLRLHALIVAEKEERVLILSFDLLALGPEVTERLHEVLDAVDGLDVPRAKRVFCCTHTHSAPAAVKLMGCGVIEADYIAQLSEAVASVAAQASAQCVLAQARVAKIELSGHSYNRRRVLDDGRVVMTEQPSTPVRKAGPVLPRMLLLRFETEDGLPVAGLVHWAAHPCTVCGNCVTGDFPGELCRQLSAKHGYPYMFLQGSCGNINPPLGDMSVEQMLGNVSSIMEELEQPAWSPPVNPAPFRLAGRSIALPYAAGLPLSELIAMGEGMKQIAETGHGPQRELQELSNILNVEVGREPDPLMLRYIAGVLRNWTAEQIGVAEGNQARTCPLDVKVLRIGHVVLCFVAAEVFAETALAIQETFPELCVALVGYASPIVGYLPTDEAMDEGGYEVAYAFKFYGHPAAFARGAEALTVATLKELVEVTQL
ncbi:MAG: hypothetical protein K1Y02_05115 [Candidatus Hydrogenedentes bacterium]|nr:hypothetical protein [Candidatus Hydrogenedentota bacterium]